MSNYKYTNNLINETSPYLLQHAHNPVNWYAWGEKALAKAQKENKLLLISVGYSACHWCHVMEKESFEDESIAEIMNKYFVCIKVDREERPDIDQIYMNAVQLITGSGGWPLNCFALPDGKPVYGGTYFKPDQWEHVLESLSSGYKKDPDKFERAANELVNGIHDFDDVIKLEESKNFTYEDILETILKLRKNFDHENGGNRGAPKFPMPVNYFPLMRYFYHSKDQDILKHITFSLEKMSNGGIYDHLGGGFARYSVDREWLVPHFEKMLYDNAQLVSLYADAFRLKPNEEYEQVVHETLDLIERDFLSPEGGFYSSYDADSEGVEGKFYLWDKYEIDMLLKEKSELFCDYYDISEHGNWEGRNILNINQSKNEIAQKYNISVEDLDKTLNISKQILFKHREKRVKPSLDDKILTSWNALTSRAYINAYNATKKEKYLNVAEKNLDFISSELLDDNLQLKRNFKSGRATINAFLDDYAIFIESLIVLYQATFKEKYIDLAHRLTQYVTKHFFDIKTGMFFFTSDQDEALIARKKELNDHVIASSNSVMAMNLYHLGHLFINHEYLEMAEQMLRNMKDQILKNPSFHGNWLDLMIQFVHQPYEVCIIGDNAGEIRNNLSNTYLPNVIFAGGTKGKLPLLENRYSESKSTIYVCQNNVCQKPVKSEVEALELINN